MRDDSLAVLICLWGLSLPACATHGVAHTAPDESRPHISWEIRSGAGGDADLVCGSAEPQPRCVLSTGSGQHGYATVHVHLHSARQPTNYVGGIRTPFLEGAGSPRVGDVNATVEPGSAPVGTTITGRVTSKPGTYSLSIELDAIEQGASTPHRISLPIPVVVN